MSIFEAITNDPRLVGLRREISQQGADVQSLDRDLHQLQKELGRTRLALAALCEIVASQLGIKHNEIVEKMLEIDLRDGQQDGRLTPVPIPCSGCGRPVAAKSQTCMYCGTPRPEERGITGPV